MVFFKNTRAGDALVVILTAVTGIILAALVFFFFKADQVIENDIFISDNIEKAKTTLVQLGQDAERSMQGDRDSFAKLGDARQHFSNVLKMLEIGQVVDGLNGIDRDLEKEFSGIKTEWLSYQKMIDTLLNSETAVKTLLKFYNEGEWIIAALNAESSEIIDMLSSSNKVPAETIKYATEQHLLIQRITTNFRSLIQRENYNDINFSATFEQLYQEISLLKITITGLLEGVASKGIKAVKKPTVRIHLQEVNKLYRSINESVQNVQSQLPRLIEIEAMIVAEKQHVTELTNDIQYLGEAFQVLASNRFIFQLKEYGLFAAIIFFIFSAFTTRMNQKRYLKESKERESKVARENTLNQGAILQLLDEIAGLGDGDLRRSATVTENITGSIADAFNFTIDQLRSLVKKINHITELVTSAAQSTQTTSTDLAVSSETQSSRISSATEAINDVAKNIKTLSTEASESTKAAYESVGTAKDGAITVRNSINGMEKIRNQIQETSKRIKRLGESSQEIGDIVGLIHDISEQTNMLALNAAIQAAMAGDAGRGFAVVADEVQHLAERSTNATKQIEKLVKTIQTDTSEAVLSMENSTMEVVEGTRLAQDAGNALAQIEAMSENIASRIDSMSEAAKTQVDKTISVNNTMQDILDITNQASAGINQTASSVGNLASLVNELRVSVSGFKLPNS